MNRIHPIHFIRELRDKTRKGEKTLTHRVINPQPVDEMEIPLIVLESKWRKDHYYWLHEPIEMIGIDQSRVTASIKYLDDGSIHVRQIPDRVVFPSVGKWGGRTLPPEWARHWIKVNGVAVRRIQTISEEECRIEGLDKDESVNHTFPYRTNYGLKGLWYGATAKASFHELWDSINKARGFPWSNNPWTFGIWYNFVKDPSADQELQKLILNNQ